MVLQSRTWRKGRKSLVWSTRHRQAPHILVTNGLLSRWRSDLFRGLFIGLNRGIKHDFPFINICKVPREVLKTEGEARGFQPSRGTLRMLMNDKIMFDCYYCINSANHCENGENIVALYFITSSHFPTRVRFEKSCMTRVQFSTHNFACAFRGAW